MTRTATALQCIRLAAMAAGLAACASSAPRPGPDQAVPPTVELLGAGTAPYRTLRIAPTVGQKRGLVLTTTMNVGVVFGTAGLPELTEMPAVVIGCEHLIASVDADGTMLAEFRIISAAVDPDPTFPVDLAVALALAVEPLPGLAGWSRVSSRGVTLEAEMATPAGADTATLELMESVKHALTRLGAPLPDEQVGVGARWRVVSQLRGSVSLRQTMLVELVDLHGGEVTLRATVEQSAPKQRIAVRDLPATTIVELVSLAGRGQAEVVLDLSRLVPVTSTLQMNTTTRSLISGEGEQLPMTKAMFIRVDIGEP